MNNDLFCSRREWLADMASKLLALDGPDLVGITENATSLRNSDACGVPVGRGQQPDFHDGSLLGVRTDAARKLGLFSPDFQFFYFEDSDLFLRYRQAGAKIDKISVPHRHIRWSGSRQLPRHVVQNILDLNRGAFFKKWSRYLHSRSFSNAVLVDLTSLNNEQLLIALAVCCSLSIDHPTAQIHIVLPEAADKRLFIHGNWAVHHGTTEGNLAYDRVWCATKPERAGDSLLNHFLKEAGCSFYPEVVKKHLVSAIPASETPPADTGQPVATICLGENDKQRQGVHPSKALYEPAAKALKARGFRVQWLGDLQKSDFEGPSHKAANVVDALSILRTSTVAITSADQFGTLAQLLGCHTISIVGATPADSFVVDWEKTQVFTNRDIDCIGCQAVWGTEERSYCLRRDEACISPSLGESLADHVIRWLETSEPSSLQHCAQLSARFARNNRKASCELDLSSWPD